MTKRMHPLLGEVDAEKGPTVLDEETSIRPDNIPPAFNSPLIESSPELPPFHKRLKRDLIDLARRILDKLDD